MREEMYRLEIHALHSISHSHAAPSLPPSAFISCVKSTLDNPPPHDSDPYYEHGHKTGPTPHQNYRQTTMQQRNLLREIKSAPYQPEFHGATNK